jgi:Zn-dependent M16 (insulinase) family peptidase
VPVLLHPLATNGIVYLDVGLDLHALPADLLPLAPVLARALLETGTAQETFARFSTRIGRETGGIRPELLTTAALGSQDGQAWLFLRGKAVLDRAGELIGILRDALLSPRLDDRDRVRQIVLEQKARLEASLVPGGTMYVASRLRAHVDEAGRAREQLRGVSQLFYVRDLMRRVDDDWAGVAGALEQARAALVDRTAMLCNVTADAAGCERVAPLLRAFFAAVPAGEPRRPGWQLPLPAANEGLVTAATVSFVGKGARLASLGGTTPGAAQVVTRYLSRTWLWDRVRIQGGAYGAACQLDHRSGSLVFVSWRDPHVLGTLATYDDSARFLRELSLSQDELTKAIIGAISDLDAYLLPDAKGWESLDRYLAGESDADRQRRRDEVLSATAADFRALADVLDAAQAGARVVVLGGQPAVDGASQARPGWLSITSVGT